MGERDSTLPQMSQSLAMSRLFACHCVSLPFFLPSLYVFTEAQLICNDVLVSGVEHTESFKRIFTLFFRF